eukprot:9099658-Pyramimonas_sp.AAC.1
MDAVQGSAGDGFDVAQSRRRLRVREALHLCAEAVGHEVEGAVGRDEGDGSVVLKAGEPYTLMELNVLQVHRLALRRTNQT